MKKETFILIASLLSFLFQACHSEDNAKTPTDELLVVKSSSMAKSTENTKDIIFTENDIQSFNTETGEIVFNSLTISEIEKRINGNESTLIYYIGNNLLFNSVFVVSQTSSAIYNDLSFVIINSKCYLLEGYPSLEIIGYNKEEHKQIREKNIRKNQPAWDIFIKHLEERGKIRR